MKLIRQLCVVIATNAVFSSANIAAPSCDNDHLDPGSGYQQWISSLDSPNPYTNDVFLTTTDDECEGLIFHWTIDKAKSKIEIAVATKATGWVGLGFSELGGMKGADIVYFEASGNTLTDSHVTDYYGMPQIDTIQDWTLKSGQVTSDGYIIFEAERALFTNSGHEDHAIVDDSDIIISDHRIIGAWGDSPQISYHGKNRVKSSIQLFSSEEIPSGKGFENFQEEMSERAEGFVQLQLSNYTIPTNETTYELVCYTTDHLVQLGLYEDKNSAPHLIGFEFIIDPNSVKYAHHIAVTSHPDDYCSETPLNTVTLWAPGDEFSYFPEGMGLQVGDTPNTIGKSFIISYHFDNRDGDANQIDNLTGLKMFYTRQPVDIEVGLVVFGDYEVNLIGQEVGLGKTKHQYTCPSTCTSERLTTVDEVTILKEFHHMHEKGKRLVNEVIRDGILAHMAVINYWDFYQNGVAQVQQEPYKLKKGDVVKTSCYYETDTFTMIGFGSQDEMCQSLAYYYPRQENFNSCGPPGLFDYFGLCPGTVEKINLDPASNFDRPVTLIEPSLPPSKKPKKNKKKSKKNKKKKKAKKKKKKKTKTQK